MDDRDVESVVLMKELSLKEVTEGTQFEINIDFKDKKDSKNVWLYDNEEDFMKEDSYEDSDTEEVLRTIEESAELKALSSPEYKNFNELAAKMIDLLPSGEVKMLIVEEGDGPLVPYDSEVTMHYAAYWENERLPFDNTLTRNYGRPMVHKLGHDQLIRGLEIGLTSVKGPTALFHLLVEPTCAWGKYGVPPRIRPERCLFTVSLLAVKDLATLDYFHQLPSEQQQSFVTTKKYVTASNAKAKELFQRKLYKKAVDTYLRSTSVINMSAPENDEEFENLKKIKTSVHINLAVCYAKLNKPKEIIHSLDQIISVVDLSRNAKVMYYYGKAFMMLGDYEQALNRFKKALKIEPTNLDIGHAMAELDRLVKKAGEHEKQIWRTAFGNKSQNDKIAVDEDFLNNIKSICEELGERNEYSKISLPNCLTGDEIECVRDTVRNYGGIVFVEDGEGRMKKLSLIKNV